MQSASAVESTTPPAVETHTATNAANTGADTATEMDTGTAANTGIDAAANIATDTVIEIATDTVIEIATDTVIEIAAQNDGDNSDGNVALLPLQTLPSFSLKTRLLKQLHLLSYRSGLSSLYARIKSSSPAAIVMYHSIPASHEIAWTDPCNCLSAEKFEAQVRFLATFRDVVSLDQLLDQLEAGEPIRRGTVAITFDDGYLNNLTVAAPILAKYNLPATIYLATAYMEKGENQWIDTIYSAFRARSQHQLTLTTLKNSGCRSEWTLTDESETRLAYEAISSYLIEATVEQKRCLLAEIDAQLAPTAYPPRLTMTWDDVRQLQRKYPNISIGVHTANHLDLSTHTECIEQEIDLTLNHVSEATGSRPQHLAFPYNRYNDQAIAKVADSELRSAVAEGEDPVVRVGSSRFGLPRIEAPQSLTMLKSWTNGGFPDLSQRLFGRSWTRPY